MVRSRFCPAEYGVISPLGKGFNPLIGTLKPHSNGLLHNSMMIGTLPVDGWAVTFDTARRGLGGQRSRPGPSLLYQM